MTSTRVALIADLREERWPSMDLVADMLAAHLPMWGVGASLLRPPMVRRFSSQGGALHAGYTADRMINRLRDYPRWLARHRDDHDVFHVTDHSHAHLDHGLPPARTIVTCHDLDTFRCLLRPDEEPRSWAFRRMTQHILSGFQRAARITCDSEATRQAILAHDLVPAERLVVVPMGVHPACSPEADPEADLEVERLLGRRDGAVELLHVGSTIPRKRIDVLLEVLARISRELPVRLMIPVESKKRLFPDTTRELMPAVSATC